MDSNFALLPVLTFPNFIIDSINMLLHEERFWNAPDQKTLSNSHGVDTLKVRPRDERIMKKSNY
jgi:hypothetical protein